MTEKLPTIKLKGKDYVQVKDRVLYFNENYTNGSISTELKLNDAGNFAHYKATITPDVDKPTRVFVARSAGGIDAEKSAEKLETVAVGRALALMGIGVLESVASADEVVNYEQRKALPPRPAGRTVKKEPYSNAEPKEIVPENALPPCPKCGGNFKLIPPGTSKKTGKAYNAFYACQTQGCKSTLDMDRAEDVAVKKAEKIFNDDVPPPPMPPEYDQDLPF